MDAVPAIDQTKVKKAIQVLIDKVERTFNFEVADFHTYFVGDQHVLVHNCNRTSARQMQNKVEKGQAPKGIERFDKADANQPNSKDHVHFKNGTSCNCDGTVHDKMNGIPDPTNKEKKFLNDNGWKTPDQVDD